MKCEKCKQKFITIIADMATVAIMAISAARTQSPCGADYDAFGMVLVQL